MPTWSIAAAAELSRRQWGGEVVVYDDRHARTHLLTAVAADVLQALDAVEGGLSTEALWACLFDEPADAAAQPASEEELRAFDVLLEQLQRLELIEARS